jgi:hypothetical protein
VAQKEDPATGAWDHPAAEVFLLIVHDQDEIGRERQYRSQLASAVSGDINPPFGHDPQNFGMSREPHEGVESCGFDFDLEGKGMSEQGLGNRAAAVVSLTEDQD